MATPAPTTPPDGGIGKDTLKYLAGVLLAGSVGGLLYWVSAKFIGAPLPGVFGRGTFLALMFLGAIAAVFGVYLLTASDLTKIKTYVFAIVCGVTWQPVLDSAKQLARYNEIKVQNSEAGDKIDNVKAAATTGNDQQINVAVRDAVPAVTEALKLSTSVPDASKKKEIANTSKEAINVLQSAASKAPETSVEAIKNISVTAANSDQPAVAIHAVQSLNEIGAKAMQKNDEATARKVSVSLTQLARDSNDLAVRAAAQKAAERLSRSAAPVQ